LGEFTHFSPESTARKLHQMA